MRNCARGVAYAFTWASILEAFMQVEPLHPGKKPF
jgi:hypothetical protein